MKKLIFPVLALPLLMICCTKEASVSKGTHATTVNVTDASEGMTIAKTSFTADELIAANYTIAGADSIKWEIHDSIPYYSNTDTAYNPGSDTLYNPGNNDTSFNSGGTDSTYTPGGDSAYTPGTDTTYSPIDTAGNGHNGSGNDSTYTPLDSTGNGHHSSNGSYIVTSKNGYVEIRITNTGEHVLLAKAYKRNADGTYTLFKKGYIKFHAF